MHSAPSNSGFAKTNFFAIDESSLTRNSKQSIWWKFIDAKIRADKDPREITFIGSQNITRDLANSIAQLIYHIDGADLRRNAVSSFVNGYEFLEACELAQVARIIEDHWSVFAPRFVRGKNRLSVNHFKTKFKTVREARNDIYHHKSVARMTDVVVNAEDLLDYLGFSLRFVFDKIADAGPQEPRFLIKTAKRHRTW